MIDKPLRPNRDGILQDFSVTIAIYACESHLSNWELKQTPKIDQIIGVKLDEIRGSLESCAWSGKVNLD